MKIFTLLAAIALIGNVEATQLKNLVHLSSQKLDEATK